MASADLTVEPLDPKRHDRRAFDCGAESLNVYLRTQASQDLKRRANAVFVLVAAEAPRVILGYFTLCALGLAPGLVPEEARNHLPRYPMVSATLIGRLAIDRSHQGQRLGGVLLARALRVAYENATIVGSS